MSKFNAGGILVLIIVFVQMAGCGPHEDMDRDWDRFRMRFIRPEGRLVDPQQDNLTHSEGQGVAMLLAEHFDDPETFASLWKWTRAHLQTRPDHLLSWSWSRSKGVVDHNNATDGDLLVAWALARAGQHWGNQAYLEDARAIARDIRSNLVRKDRRGLLLLPGKEGFEKPGYTVLNLSYWVFPAFSTLERLDPAPEWEMLRNAGITLLKESRFGRWGLPPDWIALGETPDLAPGFSDRFGYDAVRIPLYLMWAGLDTPPIMEPFRSFWSSFTGAGFIPAWANLRDDSIDSHDAPAGVKAIVQLTLDAQNRRDTSLPVLGAESGYYSAALLLMCKLMLAGRNG